MRFRSGLSLCYWAEQQGNPALAEIGLSQAAGSMDGKDVYKRQVHRYAGTQGTLAAEDRRSGEFRTHL